MEQEFTVEKIKNIKVNGGGGFRYEWGVVDSDGRLYSKHLSKATNVERCNLLNEIFELGYNKGRGELLLFEEEDSDG